ncbi:Unknown protein sequence [Pseudomonas amygdali pv. sesami]|nr:Unknown protein sequence [Pseudomonas amygdali pv. sesami]
MGWHGSAGHWWPPGQFVSKARKANLNINVHFRKIIAQ